MLFGVSSTVLLATLIGFIYGRFISSSPQMHRLRLHKVRMLESKLIRMRVRRLTGACSHCMARIPSHTQQSKPLTRNQREIPAVPTFESIRKNLELVRHELKEEPVVASTGCVLTDQIFEAARKKGIMPVDFLGPALDCDPATDSEWRIHLSAEERSAIPKWNSVDWNGELPFRVRAEAPDDIKWMFPRTSGLTNYDWLNRGHSRKDAVEYATVKWRHPAMYQRAGGDLFVLVWRAPDYDD